ncbi:hypothetical protein F9K79_11675 [Ochrobactrum sp. Kaboul]|nr:hypothetical protein F9K79_11675 [Ochrobactrum sp. Kaboul]
MREKKLADIPLLTVCKWRDFSLPVLMYPKVHSAPVLKSHHFRLVINGISNDLSASSVHCVLKNRDFFARKSRVSGIQSV